MKFTSTFVSAVLVAVSVSAFPVSKRGVDPNLVPQFGISPGVNPTGTGDCDGVNGIKIPCSCPPSRDDFINSLSANVAAGHDVNNPGVPAPFPTDNSQQSAITRMQTSISTLQNLHGAGVGCPAASTTFSAQLASLIAGNPPPAAAPAPPAGCSRTPAAAARRPGTRSRSPRTLPPDTTSTTPAVPAPFPTDDSKQSQITRLQTAISSLQNLHGAGVGCPAASTTFSAQLKALTG
ncbi:hypothetical protein MVEN_00989900 [Mycena venus]|uniref:Uncharacterized protein n=1 Tax=Mycena venus TaxID=2733690 RepID=A0A8H7D221_9AGAR|nr:hypothetical protein MVEN_00989900 [Mycena venus]